MREICSCLHVHVIRRSAAFCTNCKREREAWLTPMYSVLEQSKLVEIKAYMMLLKSLNVKQDLTLDKNLSCKKLDFTAEFLCFGKYPCS